MYGSPSGPRESKSKSSPYDGPVLKTSLRWATLCELPVDAKRDGSVQPVHAREVSG